MYTVFGKVCTDGVHALPVLLDKGWFETVSDIETSNVEVELDDRGESALRREEGGLKGFLNLSCSNDGKARSAIHPLTKLKVLFGTTIDVLFYHFERFKKANVEFNETTY